MNLIQFRSNWSEVLGFDLWLKPSLVRFYLPHSRILGYQSSSPPRIGGLSAWKNVQLQRNFSRNISLMENNWSISTLDNWSFMYVVKGLIFDSYVWKVIIWERSYMCFKSLKWLISAHRITWKTKITKAYHILSLTSIVRTCILDL